VRSYESMQRKAKAWFEKNKRWVDVLSLDYESVLADPAGSAAKIREFLGTALDAGAMARAVDPSLHRNKSAAEKPGA
jgi:LPS sulfotransferase NodH